MDADSNESSEDEYRSDWRYNCEKTYPNAPKKPRIRISVPQLKYMASAVVAVSMWNSSNIPHILSLTAFHDHCVKITHSWSSLKDVVYKLTSVLPVPRSVIEQINKLIERVHNEIGSWVTYHFRVVFLNSIKDHTVYNLVCDVVWRSDGSIDCIETAKNISKSKSPRLNDIDKYRFLCTYCLKDEIEKISPVILSDITHDYVFFNRHPLIRYWNCYFRNELHLIPKNENESLDCFMFQHRLVDNWPAKEYFFNRLDPEEQVQNAIWLIDNGGVLYQKALLLKLNKSQRISVYMARSEKIISNYIRRKDNSRDVLRTWFDIRRLITEEQFVNVFASLLAAKTTGEVLAMIWSSAENHLKLHLLNHNNYEFIKKILDSYEWTHDYNFVFSVFQDFNEEMRRYIFAGKKSSIIMNFCEELFSQCDNLSLIDRISNSLFIDKKISKGFKRYIVFNADSIQKHCLKYYSTADIKGLNNLLTYHLLSEWPDDIPKFKKQLLKSRIGIEVCARILNSETDILSELIVDAFGTDADLREKFIKKLFDSHECIIKFRNMLANKHLNDVKKTVDRYLTSNEDKKKLKKELIDGQYDLISYIFLKYDESYFESVLRWRLSEEKATMKEWMAIIQEIIPIDEIFDEILYENVTGEDNYEDVFFLFSVRHNFNYSSLDSLNRFLNWYFVSPNYVKRYKLSRIHSYTNVLPITELLSKESHDNDPFKVLIRWFFENDSVEIEKFKKMCRKDVKMRKIMDEI